MIDHAYHGNKGEQKFLRARKAGETIGLHPITIRRWVVVRKRMRRFGSASRLASCKVRSNTLSGKPMLGSWSPPHASVGMTSAPISNTGLCGSPLGRRQSDLPAGCLCSAPLLAACLLLASVFKSFSSYCAKTERQQEPSRLPTVEPDVAPGTWRRCLPVLALPNRGDPPLHGGESRASVGQITSGISVIPMDMKNRSVGR